MGKKAYNLLQHPQTVLIAGEDRQEVLYIADVLKNDGYTVNVEYNGKDAIESWHQSLPDIAILDVNLPILDGIEVASKFKSTLKQERFIPIVLLADNPNQLLYYEMMACGIADVFVRPLSEDYLLMKLKMLGSLEQRCNTLRSSYESLYNDYSHLQYQYDAAERLFLKLTPQQALELPNVKAHMSPQSLTSGDYFFYETLHNGDQYFILGDVTGHGLMAALGACSIKDIFKEFARQNCSLAALVEAVNTKLVDVLPPELFSAACLIHYKKNMHCLEIWSGGIPIMHIYNTKTGRHEVLSSNQPPLGIEKYQSDNLLTQQMSLEKDDRLLISTDGLVEAKNKNGDMFGTARVNQCLESALVASDVAAGDVYNNLCLELLRHRAGTVQADDVTLIEITFA